MPRIRRLKGAVVRDHGQLAAVSDVSGVLTLGVSDLVSLHSLLPHASQPGGGADAAVWVFWPKKAAHVVTDLTEDAVRGLALPLGLVDGNVCAIDNVRSGLKLVVRKELRLPAFKR